MKTIFVLCALMALVALVLAAAGPAGSQERFDRWFTDGTLRIDFNRTGNSGEEVVTLDRIYESPGWAGSRTALVESPCAGRHIARLADAATGEELYVRSFDSIFGEYQTTDKALVGERRTFHESVLVPRPKGKVLFTLTSRNRKSVFEKVFETTIDPSDWHILRRAPLEGVRVYDFAVTGKPSERLDVLLVAEGYTRSESGKFRRDAQRLVKVFFNEEPYRSNRSLINIRGVHLPSQQSGCDEPSFGSYRNTAVNCTFDSLDSARYVLTEDNRSLRDIAGCAPYDALYILVNHGRYGGGGIYNLYATTIVDNQWTNYVFLHEFGHSFAGLGDEYYTSSSSYNDFFPAGVEPAEPNLTALLDPGSLKWKGLVSEGVGLPSAWEKESYEKMDMEYQKRREEMNRRIAEMRRKRAPAAQIAALEEDAERLSKVHADRVDAFLAKCGNFGKVGAFEGAGYVAKGLYRPSIDCIMFSKGEKPFCPVCQQAILRKIKTFAQ